MIEIPPPSAESLLLGHTARLLEVWVGKGVLGVSCLTSCPKGNYHQPRGQVGCTFWSRGPKTSQDGDHRDTPGSLLQCSTTLLGFCYFSCCPVRSSREAVWGCCLCHTISHGRKEFFSSISPGVCRMLLGFPQHPLQQAKEAQFPCCLHTAHVN